MIPIVGFTGLRDSFIVNLSKRGVRMTEVGEPGGAKRTSKQLFVPVRTMDRAHLVSPTTEVPDFFEFDVLPDAIPIEDRVVGMMRTHHGLMVRPDRELDAPKGESMVLGQAVFQRYAVDYDVAGVHGIFTPRDVNDRRRELLELSRDTSLDPALQREYKIKEHLFRQVVTLFNGRNV